MNPFALLYLFYSAKIAGQISIYFIWLADSSSEWIAILAAAVAVLSIFPFFHIIVHIFSAKPLSSSAFIAYLCSSLLLAILWFKTTRDGTHRLLPFGLVTAFDSLALLIFLFQRQIDHWHSIFILRTEQGRINGGIDDATVRLVDGNEPPSSCGRPDTPRTEANRLQVMRDVGYDIDAINRRGWDIEGSIGSGPPSHEGDGSVDGLRQNVEPAHNNFPRRATGVPDRAGVEWATRALPHVSGVADTREGRRDLEKGQQRTANDFVINRGADGNVDDHSRNKHTGSRHPLERVRREGPPILEQTLKSQKLIIERNVI